MRTLPFFLSLVPCALAATVALATPAVPIDGTLDPAYGPALATQTVQTDNQDNPAEASDVTHAQGSELDQAFAFVSGGVLHLFLSGNLRGYFNVEWYPQSYLHVFIDSKPGGQNTLRGDNAGVGFYPNALNLLAGLTFDAGFEPDYWFNCTVWSQDPPLYAYGAELLAAGGGNGLFLGRAAAGGPGTLSGGTNPDGIEVSIDNRNFAGVTAGCGAASGAGVTTGIEWAIPLAAIGNPTGCFRVCALVNTADPVSNWLMNQVMGPLPPGSCGIGAPASVSFASIPGDQFVTVCTGVTPARSPSWGAVKTLYR